MHILILDDDPSVARIMQTALSHKDFQIDVMAEPTHMEAQLQVRPYHIVILDYIIPGLESEKVLGWVREYQPTASIIVVTGYPTIDSALNCLRAGTFDYLTKPFQMSQLQHVVMRCLENKGLLRLSEEALRESLGAAIRERRKALGLTLAQMAQRTERQPWLSLADRVGQELGLDRNALPNLARLGREDVRSLPGCAIAFLMFRAFSPRPTKSAMANSTTIPSR